MCSKHENIVTKITDGTPVSSSSSALPPTEKKLVDDAQSIINDGIEIDEDAFVKASGEPQYEGKINQERAKELYKLLK